LSPPEDPGEERRWCGKGEEDGEDHHGREKERDPAEEEEVDAEGGTSLPEAFPFPGCGDPLDRGA